MPLRLPEQSTQCSKSSSRDASCCQIMIPAVCGDEDLLAAGGASPSHADEDHDLAAARGRGPRLLPPLRADEDRDEGHDVAADEDNSSPRCGRGPRRRCTRTRTAIARGRGPRSFQHLLLAALVAGNFFLAPATFPVLFSATVKPTSQPQAGEPFRIEVDGSNLDIMNNRVFIADFSNGATSCVDPTLVLASPSNYVVQRVISVVVGMRNS